MSIPCEAPYCALNDGHDGEHSHVDGLVSRADRAYDERNAELEALRAQVATLTAERDVEKVREVAMKVAKTMRDACIDRIGASLTWEQWRELEAAIVEVMREES